MNEAAQGFVERMGLMMEADGMPRIAGRLFGFLLIHPESYSLDELADRLQVSKASVSTNARFLEQLGLLERSAEPGDRRDFYRVGPGAWENVLRSAQRRWRALQEVFAEAIEALPPEMEAGRLRLREADRFHDLMMEATEGLIQRWRESSSGSTGSGIRQAG